MNIQDIEKLINLFKKNKPMAFRITLFLILTTAGGSWLISFCSERAKQSASNIEETKSIETEPKEPEKSKTDSEIHIEQHTEGEKSPAIVSEGDVKINFENKSK